MPDGAYFVFCIKSGCITLPLYGKGPRRNFEQEDSRMRSLSHRVIRLEHCQEEEAEHSAVTLRLLFAGQRASGRTPLEPDGTPLEPGTRILHVTLDGPSWWGVIDEDGTEEWVGNA